MAAAAPQTTASADGDFIRFPPFPPVPQGVKVTPFKTYKETGIKLSCPNDDGIEVDGLNIPTVELEHKHATDNCKTDAFREKEGQPRVIMPKKRKLKAKALLNASPRKWWEIWQDEEAGKFTAPYNPKTPVIDRLSRAATDFRTSRAWPKPETRQLGVDKLWDQFAVFIGLQAIIPAWIRAERVKAEQAVKAVQDVIDNAGETAIPQEESDDGISDDEAPIIKHDTNESVLSNVNQEQSLEDEDTKAIEEEETAAIEEEKIRKDDRMLAFLADPETAVKMFLSSYMRKEGLIWSDPNLFNAPRVLSFFFRFVLRNKLLQEHEDGLKKALAIIERAQKELPYTSVIAKIIPCEVGLALRDQFGSKAETFQYKILDDHDAKVEGGNADADDVKMEDVALEESTVEYVGDGEYIDVTRPVDVAIARIDGVVEDNEDDDRARKKAKLDSGMQEQETAMDVDKEVVQESGTAEDVDKEATGGWGSWDVQSSWCDDIEASKDDWSLPAYSLSKFLGLDALPATHTTGVVEESVRKIISVHAPGLKSDITGTLEGQLESKLGRVVLAPWNEWDIPIEGDGLDEIRRVYTEIYRGKSVSKGIRKFDSKVGEEGRQETEKSEGKPTRNPEEYYDEDVQDNTESTEAKIIWENSRGWVVDPSSGNIVLSNRTREKPDAKALPEGRKAYNPHKDTIEVVVDPVVIDKLKDVVGMGLGCTFVQMIREAELASSGESTSKHLWYMEDLKVVIPSFYTS